MKLNLKTITGFFIFSSALVAGQKKEFVIRQNQDLVFNKISEFKNNYTENDIQSGFSSPDGEMSTFIVLKNLREPSSYLTLKLNKNAKAKPFVKEASWKATTKSVNSSTTKVSIELESIQPDDFSKKDIDIRQTRSNGKLEKELEAYLKDTSVEASPAETIGSNDQASNEDAEKMVADTAEYLAFGKTANRKKSVSGMLKTLFGKGLISLPATEKKFSQLLKKSPEILSCDDCMNSEYYSWNFEDYFNMIYVKMNDNEEYYSLQYYGEDEVSGLPHGLIFNNSSPTECRDKFVRYNAQLYQTAVNVDENTSKALTLVTFKMNTSYIRLEFGNEYLTKIIVSNKEQ